MFPGVRRVRSPPREFSLYVQYLAGCRESNPSCCDRSQVCTVQAMSYTHPWWATHIPMSYTYPYELHTSLMSYCTHIPEELHTSISATHIPNELHTSLIPNIEPFWYQRKSRNMYRIRWENPQNCQRENSQISKQYWLVTVKVDSHRDTREKLPITPALWVRVE